jgi:spermidine/putrescine transport system permease protein
VQRFQSSSSPLLVYAVLYTLFLYAPIGLLVLFSFNDGTLVTFPLSGFTVKWYEELFGNREMISAFANSLKVGAAVAALSTVIGTLAAKAVTNRSLPGRGVITGLIMLPLVIPSIVVGISILLLIRFGLGLTPSLWVVGASHVLLCVPFSMMIMKSCFEGFDRSIEEASLDLGQNRFQTFRRITLPLSLPAVVASLLICFTVSLDEFVLAFFLSGNDATLPIFIFSQLRFPSRLPSVLALGSLVVLVSAAFVLLAQLLRRGAAPDAEPLGL